eukprot:TRINITY_DN7324_c0_g1_i1.p1 TRINITY_DN7324_c0_g1~~TRINITY_DN7324_c0_g1_i1.p1  ORF type:complete len:1088 (+),score=214.86 TRINITY_DN7324_c0_g1_i1:124-3387(+)
MKVVPKALQRRVFTLLTTKWGILILLLGALVTLNSTLGFLSALLNTLPWVRSCGSGCKANFHDNVAGRSFEDDLCNVGIDLVYTWVNGSDPRQQKALVDFYAATTPNVSTIVVVGNDTVAAEQEGANRFRDNQELLFSLRSIEKFAPWIRHVYIVTSGQIPNWLNLDNPRVSVVPHDAIFANQSHLPTFSSPAIETNLDRIPGLSQRFVYCNDDTFFGNELWPDDFYTKSGGQKVFLSWPVPNCAEGCPSSWIGDGYCDRACNTSSCDWDGGDCLNATSDSRYSRWSSSGNSGSQDSSSSWWKNRGSQYCAPGCPDAWIGDRYCDRACKFPACGYDGGDCGFDLIFNELPGINVTVETNEVVFPTGTLAAYLNLTWLFPHEAKITQGSHDQPGLVRSARISQAAKVMVLALQKNHNETTIRLGIQGEIDKEKLEHSFNITVDTHVDEPAPPPAPPSTNVTATAPSHNVTTTSSSASSAPSAGATTSATPATSPVPVAPVESAATQASSATSTTAADTPAVSTETVAPVAAPAAEAVPLVAQEVDASASGEPLQTDIVNNHALHEGGTHSLDPDGQAPDDASHTAAPVRRRRLLQSATASSGSFLPMHGHIGILDDLAPLYDRLPWTLDSESMQNMIASVFAPENVPTTRAVLLDNAFMDDVALFERITDSKRKQLQLAAQVNGELDVEPDVTCAHGLDDKQEGELSSAEEKDNEPWFPWEEDGFAWPDPDAAMLPIEPAAVVDKHAWQYAHMAALHQMPHLNTSSRLRAGARSLLVDTYGDSLRHVNKLLNKEFGSASRKVPAHMCHMIDREVIQSIRHRWGAPWNATSSHQVRSSYDMQFAFTYFYYLMNERDPFDLQVFFNKELDMDHDGVLDDVEFRLLSRFLTKEVTLGYMQELRQKLLPTRYSDKHVLPGVEDIRNNAEIYEKLKKEAPRPLKHKHQVVTLDDVSFMMIHDNDTKTRKDLDSMRHEQRKFVCLNDDMNKTHPNPKVIEALHDFYMSYFPLKSQFELPDGQVNQFLWFDDYMADKQAREHALHVVLALMSIMFCCALIIGCLCCGQGGRVRRVLGGCCSKRNARDSHLQLIQI